MICYYVTYHSTPASLSGTPTLLFSGPRAGRKRRLKDSIAALSCDTDNLESPMVPAHKRRSSYNDTPSRMSISASSILDGSQTPESCSSAKLAGTNSRHRQTCTVVIDQFGFKNVASAIRGRLPRAWQKMMQWPRCTPVPELQQDIQVVWNTRLSSCSWKPPRYGGRSGITFLKPSWSIPTSIH